MEGQGINHNNDDLDTIDSVLNQIFTGMRVSTRNSSLIDNVMDQSFREQTVQQFAASKEFIQGLEKIQIQEGDEYSCGICLEEFKVGENVLKLPCKDTPHYFHFKEDKEETLLDLVKEEELEETCEGILPWLKIKNSCPICRCEFPKGEPIVLNNSASDSEGINRGMNQNIMISSVIRPVMNNFLYEVDLTEEQGRGLQQGPVPEGDVPLVNNGQEIDSPEVEQGPIEIRPRIVNLSDMIHQSMNTILEEREERMMQEVIYQSFLDSRQGTDESIINEIDDTSENQ